MGGDRVSGLRERSVSEASRAVRRSRLAQSPYPAVTLAEPVSNISVMNRSRRVDSWNSLDARLHRQCWGRIGMVGRARVDLFENEHAALGALEAIERIKRKRGYQDATT